jgi:2-polyprenyl-6-methoxyphenol hydroxylase-like FAD-dependent oxidoreductase
VETHAPVGLQKRYSVIVCGAGPTGLTLAIDLGMRGVDCLVVERLLVPSPWPKFDRCNARTMEFYRRLGLAEGIRELGYPPDEPMDVYVLTRMSEPPIVHLPYPSVTEWRSDIAACADGSLPLEPPQLVSQNRSEPFLRSCADALPNVSVRYGSELMDLHEDARGVTVTVRAANGAADTFRCDYLVGCDGAASTVRKKLDIPLEGVSRDSTRQVVCFSEDFYDRIPAGRGRHYYFADEHRSRIIVQGDRKEFTFQSTHPDDTDFERVIRDLAGFDFDLEIRNISTWTPRLLLAERFSAGRCFLAGDAAHQVIPTGGLGMNTGVGDALNLSWKLAGAVAGWGGRPLLDTYDTERRRVAARNRQAALWGAEGVREWQALVQPGRPPDESLAESARVNHARMYGMFGAEWGYSYAGSPAIRTEPDDACDWDITRYTPSAAPGRRIPHMWLRDGKAIQDVLGQDYTLVDLAGDADFDDVVAAFGDAGVPLHVLRLSEPRLQEVYGCSLLLVRPDLHVAWRGHAPPGQPAQLVMQVAGTQAWPVLAHAAGPAPRPGSARRASDSGISRYQ